MGIVLQEQQFDDDYSKEIIAKVRELSVELDEWIATESYLLETSQENVNSLWIRNRLLTKVIDQLNDYGIIFSQDIDQMLDSPLMIDTILTLRAKFDPDRLYAFLRNHQSLREDIEEIIGDDCIEDVISLCSRTMSLDEGWESLSKVIGANSNVFGSTGVFNDLLDDVIARCKRLGDEEIVPNDDMNKLLQYTKFLSERKNKIASIVSIIYSTTEQGSQIKDKMEIALNAMREFETELSRPKAIREFIDDTEFTPKSFVEKRRMFYVSKWRHCFEYWIQPEHQTLLPSDLEAAILVATLYVDAPDPEHARVYVVETFENLIDQLGNRYAQFRDIIDRAISNIVVVEGGVTYATI